MKIRNITCRKIVIAALSLFSIAGLALVKGFIKDQTGGKAIAKDYIKEQANKQAKERVSKIVRENLRVYKCPECGLIKPLFSRTDTTPKCPQDGWTMTPSQSNPQ